MDTIEGHHKPLTYAMQVKFKLDYIHSNSNQSTQYSLLTFVFRYQGTLKMLLLTLMLYVHKFPICWGISCVARRESACCLQFRENVCVCVFFQVQVMRNQKKKKKMLERSNFSDGINLRMCPKKVKFL